MIVKIRSLLNDVSAYWRLGMIVALIVAGLLAIGLSLRTRFIAEAAIDIGGVRLEVNQGLYRFRPFEEASDIEAYFEHEVFKKASYGFKNRCNAKVAFSPNGPVLKMMCRDNSREQVKKLVYTVLRLLQDRHALYYKEAVNYREERLSMLKRRLEGAERVAQALRKGQTNSLIEAQIIQNQISIEELKVELSSANQQLSLVRQTALDEKNLLIIDRNPNGMIWVIAIVLALGSGTFVAAYTARTRRIEYV